MKKKKKKDEKQGNVQLTGRDVTRLVESEVRPKPLVGRPILPLEVFPPLLVDASTPSTHTAKKETQSRSLIQ